MNILVYQSDRRIFDEEYLLYASSSIPLLAFGWLFTYNEFITGLVLFVLAWTGQLLVSILILRISHLVLLNDVVILIIATIQVVLLLCENLQKNPGKDGRLDCNSPATVTTQS